MRNKVDTDTKTHLRDTKNTKNHSVLLGEHCFNLKTNHTPLFQPFPKLSTNTHRIRTPARSRNSYSKYPHRNNTHPTATLTRSIRYLDHTTTDKMEDIPEHQEFWILVCSFLGCCCWIGFYYPSFFYYSSWLRHPSPPPQTVSVAEPAFPPSPPRPRRPAPKYITLADLAKKVDKTWLGHYPPGDGMSAHIPAVANYPARNFYACPSIQRGRWVDLSAAAGPAPPPVHNPEQHAASLVKFSAFMRTSAAEPPFVPPRGLQDALRPRQPPPFVFPRPKGPPSNWQGPMAYTNNSLSPRPAPMCAPPLPRAIDRWPPLLPRQRFGTDASRFTETAVRVPAVVSFGEYARVERRPAGHSFL
jgi:hypothetical protein